MLVAAQPHGAPTWFPCNDRMADKATYRVTVRTDPGYRVVSNGTLTAERRLGRRVEWVHEQRQPDGHVPRHAADRALRARAPGQRCGAECAGGPRGPDAGRSRRVRRPAPDDRHLRRDVRALPVRRLHRRRHRRRARHPAGVTDPVDLRHQPPQPCLGGAAAHRPRAGPPVVREHGHRRLAAATSGCTRASPATPSGCGPRPSGRTTAQEEARRHHALLARKPQDLVLTDPGAHRTFDDRVYKRGALTLHILRRAVGDDAFFALLRIVGRHPPLRGRHDRRLRGDGARQDRVSTPWPCSARGCASAPCRRWSPRPRPPADRLSARRLSRLSRRRRARRARAARAPTAHAPGARPRDRRVVAPRRRR